MPARIQPPNRLLVITSLIVSVGMLASMGCVPLRKRTEASSLTSTPAAPPALALPVIDASKLSESVAPGPPSHNRPWRIQLAVLPYAEIGEDEVTIRNVRQCRWKSESEKAVHHQDWKFDWQDVQGADFIVVPFQTMPMLAHTMLSFRLSDGRALVVSVEARLEQHEVYSPLAGAAKQYELMYVIGDEQDLLGLRGDVRNNDVYLYPTVATPPQSALLLRNILQRTNQIAATAEYYDSLTNNCTTNIIDHVLKLRDESAGSLRLRDQWRSRFPGNSDLMAYELGLLAGDLSFDQLRTKAWCTSRIRQHIGEENFSVLIRQPANASQHL